MNRTVTLLLSILVIVGLQAQQVYKCCNTTNSSFLLGSMNYARHNQGIYLPSDFQNATAGNIDRLYFRYGSSANVAEGNTLTDLTISLLQSQQTSHVNDLFITSVIPVMTSAEFTIAPGVADQWFSIELDEPFPYDPSLSLIVDIRFDQSERNITCRATPTPGRKLATGDPLSPVGTTTSTNLHDIGFDLDSPTGIPSYGPMVTLLYPNPATDHVQIRFDQLVQGTRTAEVVDAGGRVLLQQLVPDGSGSVDLNVAELAPGIYLVRLVGEDGVSQAQPFVRE